MSDLKPCPFCGGEAECTYGINVTMFDSDMRPVYIVCKECGAATKQINVSNKYCAIDLAVKEWNRRDENE